MQSHEEKLSFLREDLAKMGKVLIAFSGGVDSTFLLYVAHEVLGENALPVTIKSSLFPAREFGWTVDFCRKLGLSQQVIISNELDNPEFYKNSPERCYICKKAILGEIFSLARNLGIEYVADGTNLDDLDDYRPGMRALKEMGIHSPLLKAGLTKENIRFLSKEASLPTWNLPSFACLSSRIPYGQKITREKLQMIEKAEQYLMDLGFEQVRVRHHGDIARVEVTPEERVKFFDPGFMDQVYDFFKSIGFLYAVLDLRGYRSGSMNEKILSK